MPLPPPPPPPPPPTLASSSSVFAKRSQKNAWQGDSLGHPQIGLSQDPFKDELKDRLSSLELSKSFSKSKCSLQSEQQRLLPLISPSGEMSPSRNNYALDKPQSSSQSDRRPFAYSPDVNDPNRKGKLDLSQIKSPSMRRRLLANMQSADEEEDEKSYDGSSINHISENDLTRGQSHVYNNAAEPLEEKKLLKENVVIRYNEPVTFHNYNACCTNVNHDNDSSIRELDMELARSLDSLSQLVSNLESDCAAVPAHHVQYHPPQQVMTIFPTQSSAKGNSRTIGDYMLSPDSSYFLMSSSGSPYSISPYYGTNIDINQVSMTNRQPIRGTSSRTFSPNRNYTEPKNTGNSLYCSRKK